MVLIPITDLLLTYLLRMHDEEIIEKIDDGPLYDHYKICFFATWNNNITIFSNKAVNSRIRLKERET